jgi:hypothetical protein
LADELGLIITEGIFRKKGRVEDINLLKEIRRKIISPDRRFEKSVEDIQSVINEINEQKDFS